ncbi:MAG: AmmeMemoRadiSam system radical SAM enzyme [Candidatus Omnitrophica bacterium]|nr:AmmeMemoRadiSam system radical SAM enzyme [Candidatus Omnitrophota bacterium]
MLAMTRRDFLKIAACAGAGFIVSGSLSRTFSSRYAAALPTAAKLGYEHEAMFYDPVDESTVRCRLCPNECLLTDGQRSFCRVREPSGGKLYTLNYGYVCARHVDPIEKKPFYHFLPGTAALSIATAGCNLRCKFCQNWQISQSTPEDTTNEFLSPETVVQNALDTGSRSIAYTYSEPNIFYEYVTAIAGEARAKGVKSVYVTGGYINQPPLKAILKHLDAVKVDFKGYNEDFLRSICQEKLETVLETMKTIQESGVWLEIVNLVVPTLNDDLAMIRSLCSWIRENLGTDVPLHFSRFWPMYKLKNLAPTPLETLLKARTIALGEGIRYVYVGNVGNDESNHTYCPSCKKIVIKRRGYVLAENNIKQSSCAFCGQKIAGIWQ